MFEFGIERRYSNMKKQGTASTNDTTSILGKL
jgi:hypothetical protein